MVVYLQLYSFDGSEILKEVLYMCATFSCSSIILKKYIAKKTNSDDAQNVQIFSVNYCINLKLNFTVNQKNTTFQLEPT